ncbi:MAG: hemerythrin domain-containing protein [Bacteroidetes bacterium]|nr:hemerythrin domain-containing protein [Bacteroidota bacterium]
MQRYDIFRQIHKGLRALLYETALLLQQTDFTDTRESKKAIEQLNQVVDLFDKHAHTEDNFVLPSIQQYEPSVSGLFEQEHVEDHALGMKLRDLLGKLGQASQAEAEKLGAETGIAYVAFMVFNLNHMAKEEDMLNKLLWRYFTDGELHGITENIIAHQPPQAMGLFSKWMIRGLNNFEITKWLSEIKNNAPDPVFQGMIMMAENELPANRWDEIQSQLTEGAMLA